MGDECVYPGPHGVMSEEDYLPVALGRVRNLERLKGRVCKRCNEKIGANLEMQFARAGPTGLFRWILGIKGRTGLPPSPFRRGARGAPPILMLGRPSWSEYDLLSEVEPGTEDALPLRQTIFDDPVGGPQPVVVPDEMRGHPELLLEHLKDRGLEGLRPKYVVAWSDDGTWVGDLVKAAGGGLPDVWEHKSGPPERIQLTATVRVTPSYFRAVAKIAFHYALKMLPDLAGTESQFSPIKEFIWTGGNIDRFVRQRPDQFVANFRRGDRPTHWMHIIHVERADGQITGFAQFFAGPHVLPPGYEIRIGSDPSPILRPPERHGHYFVITDPGASPGIVGEMVDAQPANHIWVVPW